MIQELPKVPIIGFVRYSQKIDFGGVRDMFEPEYFEYRFQIFKNITLKSFQSQTNKDFLLLILHSENIPPHYKKRFSELERDNMFLKNIFVGDSAEAFEESLQNSFRYLSFQNGTAVTFRIDNDDAVQSTFIQTLTHYQNSEFLGYSICIPSIFVVKHINENEFIIEELNYPENSVGLAYVTDKAEYKTVLELGEHQFTNDQIPMILLARNTNKAVVTINGENAANQIHTKFSKLFSKEELDDYLANFYIKDIGLSCLKILKDDNKMLPVAKEKLSTLLMPPLLILFQRKVKLLFTKNNKARS